MKAKPKKKLIATFKGPEAEALHNDKAEITGIYIVKASVSMSCI